MQGWNRHEGVPGWPRGELGRSDNLSTQELTIIELITKDWLILQSIDSYLLQAGLFNKRKKSAYSLTIQRGTIADGLTRRLLASGLNRRSKPVQSLAQLLANTSQTEQNWPVRRQRCPVRRPPWKP